MVGSLKLDLPLDTEVVLIFISVQLKKPLLMMLVLR